MMRLQIRGGLVLLAAAVVALAGCGNGSSPAQPSPTSPSAAGTTSTAPTDAPPTTPSTPPVPTNKSELLAYIQAGSLVNANSYNDPTISGGEIPKIFSSPSGNIECVLYTAIGSGALECVVAQNIWSPVTPLACNSTATWEGGAVGAGPGGWYRGDCLGDENNFTRHGPTLPYGKTLNNGVAACRSESSFVACVNLASGNGFVIAREIIQGYGPQTTGSTGGCSCAPAVVTKYN